MLLALDTSTSELGVALYDGIRVLNETAWVTDHYHTVELAPAVLQALDRAGGKATDLQAVAVAVGPGSFTSLRVGLAFAKGMALVLHIPLIGIPTLDVVANAQPLEDLPLVAVVRAGRGRLAAGWYHAIRGTWRSSGEIELLTPQKLSGQIQKPTVICGELSAKARQILGRKYKNARLASPARSLRRPALLAELAWARYEAGKIDDPVTLSPIYVKTGHEASP